MKNRPETDLDILFNGVEFDPDTPTTLVEEYDDGSQLHRPEPIAPVEEFSDEIKRLSHLLSDEVALFDSPRRSIGYKIENAASFNPEHSQIERYADIDRRAYTLMKLCQLYLEQTRDLVTDGFFVSKVRGRLVEPTETEFTSTYNVFHSDLIDRLTVVGFRGMNAKSTDYSLVGSATLGESTGVPQGTRWLSEEVVLDSVQYPPLEEGNEFDLFWGETDESIAIVTQNEQSIAAMPRANWQPEPSAVEQLDEATIGRIDLRSIHKSGWQVGLGRLSLLASISPELAS